ncbi:MAG TPA: tRNA lysidine(34) synthetase TilS [Vicinamibacterales bacterium]|nr:tRNA lysidine(34) synthetase TilS [Vicinamibacterales bacterium]
MGHVVERVRHFSSRHSLWAPETRVLAAVSGGSDSVALLLLLRDLAARGEVVLAGLAHLHHHIRGDAADADAAFCRALADRLGVPAVIGDANVPGEAAEHGVSTELAGRYARQRFFKEAMVSVRADRVATAHTRDDQAETVLLRLTRGAGTSGLSAMAPRRDHLVRPLLDVSRADLQAFLRGLNEPWRDDATNEDQNIPRNRIRHGVMPQLRAINAQADAALGRAAELMRGDDEFLENLANAAFVRVVELEEQGAQGEVRVRLRTAEFLKLPMAIARRVARFALETANPSRTYGLEEADELHRALGAGSGGNIPGLSVERFGASAVLISRVPKVPKVPRVPKVSGAEELRLEIPGTVESPLGTWTISAEGPLPRPATIGDDAAQVMVDAGALGGHLLVRHRRPGDRLQPLGAPGRKKVQDVLVDRKVPRDDRDALPIVTTESGEIIWVAGQVLADPFRVTPLTTSVVVLTLRR